MPDTKAAPIHTLVARKYRKYLQLLAVAVLVIFHAVGFWGLLFSGEPAYFAGLTPMNLLLTNVLLFAFHRRWNAGFLLFVSIVFTVGFFSEVIGIHTGLLFGDYVYGDALGLKVWDVPLLIGLNWLMLVYTTGVISNRLPLPWLAKAVMATLLMVLLDYFIEPVAMQFDFWDWRSGSVPLSNYAGWFGIALLLQLYFQKGSFSKENAIAPYVYLIQLFFFIFISLLL